MKKEIFDSKTMWGVTSLIILALIIIGLNLYPQVIADYFINAFLK
jgi:hypothetical protein